MGTYVCSHQHTLPAQLLDLFHAQLPLLTMLQPRAFIALLLNIIFNRRTHSSLFHSNLYQPRVLSTLRRSLGGLKRRRPYVPPHLARLPTIFSGRSRYPPCPLPTRTRPLSSINYYHYCYWKLRQMQRKNKAQRFKFGSGFSIVWVFEYFASLLRV